MTHADKLADAVERSEKVEKWPERLARLKKEKGIKKFQFCEKHGLCKFQLSRHCKGRNNATWETIDKVEKALLIEGV